MKVIGVVKLTTVKFSPSSWKKSKTRSIMELLNSSLPLHSVAQHLLIEWGKAYSFTFFDEEVKEVIESILALEKTNATSDVM